MKKKRGNRRRWLLAVVFAVIASVALLSILIVPFVLWQLKPFTVLDAWVVDKTVPYPNFREHKGIFWVLNHEKLTAPGKRKLYDQRKDYYGFFPEGPRTWKTLAMPVQAPQKPDLIYLADTYGVYTEDYLQARLSGEFSKKMYGGLSAEDNQSLRNHLGEGNTLIAEFNTVASPTYGFERKELGVLLHMRWRGWIGRLYEDLTRDNEVPDWVVRNYESQKKKPWDFFGRGFVIIRDDLLIEVFPWGTEAGKEGMKVVYRDAWAKRFGITEAVSYKFWFEWSIPDNSVEIVADFEWDLTDAGKEHLRKFGLPTRFPAVMHTVNPQFNTWYFAGDFADLEFARTPFGATGIDRLKRVLVDDSFDSNDYFYWRAYVPMFRYILGTIKPRRDSWKTRDTRKDDPVPMRVRTKGRFFQVRQPDGVWKDLVVKGTNLGMALPGKYSTEFLDDIDTFVRWFKSMGEMGINVIRIYTLPSPVFYQALDNYNRNNPQSPIYLLQGIWPEEHPPQNNYLAPGYQKSFLKEIEYAVDAVYGHANIKERRGRAWGVYTTDCSRWLLGWLMGRELESPEVMATDQLNPGVSYKGTYVSSGPAASPTEVWIAESMDEIVKQEMAVYGKIHPVGLVSWPTLDRTSHDFEWYPGTGKTRRFNDNAVLDINNIDTTPEMTAGIFGAYHIYPNYPDFLNDEKAYGGYRDSRGRFMYGGYLREFMAGHAKYPALVAEFGLPTGSAVAHYNPDGFNHGAIDEKFQGEGTLRMYDAILAEGYMGAVLFEWIDEWVKKTWTTEPFMIPFERHIYWHNVDDPEQNYGIVAMTPEPPTQPGWSLVNESGIIRSVNLAHDPSYMYMDVELERLPDFSRETLYIGLDTYRRELGQMRYPVGNIPFYTGMEFLLVVNNPDVAELKVITTYNKHLGRYDSKPLYDGAFERILQIVNAATSTRDGRQIPAQYFNMSELRRGDFSKATHLWKIENKTLRFRIPWFRLNFTDPSSVRVLHDLRWDIFNPLQDQLKTEKTEGVLPAVLLWDTRSSQVVGRLDGNPGAPFIWKGWELPPPYRERLKESYYVLRKAWATDVRVSSTP